MSDERRDATSGGVGDREQGGGPMNGMRPDDRDAAVEPLRGERRERHRETHGTDPVLATSAQSFPASDPPSWSGSSSSPGGQEELPPQGEQASWSVEHEAAESGRAFGTGMDDDHDPDDGLPVPPEDALQG